MFRVILAMSESAKEIKQDLKGASKNIIEHLLKIYLMPNHQSNNHWRREIFKFLHDIQKLSTSKRYPAADQIYKWTYGRYQDVITDLNRITGMVATIEFDYDQDFSSEDPSTVLHDLDNICCGYFKWLSAKLSKFGVVTPSEVYEKLDKLLQR